MKIFKFGGASIRDAEHIRNVAQIIGRHKDEPLLVVISALGKTTNAMEEVVQFTFDKKAKKAAAKIKSIQEQHLAVLQELLGDNTAAKDQLNQLFDQVYDIQKFHCLPEVEHRYNRLYDMIVPYGEMISTTLVNLYLRSQDYNSCWLDVRSVIKTEEIFREGKVLWDITQSLVEDKIRAQLKEKIIITQGFLGGTVNGATTTLGREGSDYTAAILAYCLNADSVTIWKDVAGVLNADPKRVKDTQLLEQISYHEALELSYAGASVIHPKTIKPLQSKNIPLRVFSFYNPEEKGTIIVKEKVRDKNISSLIFKDDQVLLKLQSKDFSFITEQNLSHIFGLLSEKRIKANMMQLTAADFSVCVNQDRKLEELFQALEEHYHVKQIDGLQMITIRHYSDPVIQNLLDLDKVLLSEKLEDAARFVLKA